jgi:hypothetical protein
MRLFNRKLLTCLDKGGRKMALPDSYTVKPGSIPAYFDAMRNAEAPERFTPRFLENLEFKSTNDRLFIGVLKDLGFLDEDGIPTKRYYEFLDKSQSTKVVAEGVREAYSDLFAVNTEAYKLSTEEVKSKLRTLYAGSKKNNVISRIASTFTALCEWADFSASKPKEIQKKDKDIEEKKKEKEREEDKPKIVSLDSLQYHINIVLPETREQAVYDAIFKSLKEHLSR